MGISVQQAQSMEEAGGALLDRALDPRRWAMPGNRRVSKDNLCQVGNVEVCAGIDVTPTLDTFLRVSFRGPELSPMQASEFLEKFISPRFTFVPNSEWLVEIDARRWIHFSKPYTRRTLEA